MHSHFVRSSGCEWMYVWPFCSIRKTWKPATLYKFVSVADACCFSYTIHVAFHVRFSRTREEKKQPFFVYICTRKSVASTTIYLQLGALFNLFSSLRQLHFHWRRNGLGILMSFNFYGVFVALRLRQTNEIYWCDLWGERRKKDEVISLAPDEKWILSAFCVANRHFRWKIFFFGFHFFFIFLPFFVCLNICASRILFFVVFR